MTDDEDFTGCPACESDDYVQLDDEQLARGGYDLSGPAVYRCEDCGEEWA